MATTGYEIPVFCTAFGFFMAVPVVVMVAVYIAENNISMAEVGNRILWRHEVVVEDSYPDGFLEYVYVENIFGMKRYKKTRM